MKTKYRVRNWAEYNKALIKRGSITIWFSEEAKKNWYNQEKSGKKGKSKKYSDDAIKCMMTLKVIYRMPLRGAKGLVESIMEIMKIKLDVADYTTLCRRQRKLEIELPRIRKGESIHAVFDTSGFKIYGEGEWKARKHGYSKRRTWRKMHIGYDEATNEFIVVELTENNVGDPEMLIPMLNQIEDKIDQVSADGIYDSFENYEAITKRGAKATIPPRCTAKIKKHGNNKSPPLPRDEIIRSIRTNGLKEWKKESGYHRRSLSETAFYRIKTIFGDHLKARNFENQCVEAKLMCRAINLMTHLGMPDSYPVSA